MFKNPTFAVSNVMMLTLGVALFGSTVLLPQYLQVFMGYTAQQSGMALSPGGFVVILLLPFVGFMVSRVDARYMIGFGFLALSSALFFMTRHLYGGIDFRTAVELRVIQSIGLPFLFIPINTLVYAGVPPEKNNAVSGIVNLSRNMGGDIGIAAVTTLIARRSQFHQSPAGRPHEQLRPQLHLAPRGAGPQLRARGRLGHRRHPQGDGGDLRPAAAAGGDARLSRRDQDAGRRHRPHDPAAVPHAEARPARGAPAAH